MSLIGSRGVGIELPEKAGICGFPLIWWGSNSTSKTYAPSMCSKWIFFGWIYQHWARRRRKEERERQREAEGMDWNEKFLATEWNRIIDTSQLDECVRCSKNQDNNRANSTENKWLRSYSIANYPRRSIRPSVTFLGRRKYTDWEEKDRNKRISTKRRGMNVRNRGSWISCLVACIPLRNKTEWRQRWEN